MHSVKVLPAVAAIGARVVFAQSSCSSTLTITDAAQATDIACRTLGGLEISPDLSGDITIDGPERVTGDFIVNNATDITSLRSDSLATVEGKFQLFGLRDLRTVNFPELTSINEIDWTHLNSISELTLGQSGVTEVKSVTISDTELRNLDDFNVASAETIRINNNRRLTSYDTQLANVSGKLEFQSNGQDFNITLANLVWANSLDIRNVQSILMPSLEHVNESLYFEACGFESFSAPNLTEVEKDVSLVDNKELTNVSFPLLERIGGGITIVNNTELETIDGFPELEEVGGAVRFGGNFTEVDFPSLQDVVGTFTIRSTSEDLEDSCSTFEDMDGSELQGRVTCVSGDADANNADFDGDGSSGGSSNSNDDDSASGMLSANVFALGAVALVGALAQL